MKQSPYSRANIGKGIGYYVTGRAVAAIATMIVVLLMVRAMSVQDYGVFVILTGTATILVMLSLCGLDRVVLKFLPEGRLNASAIDLAAFVMRMIVIRMTAAAVLGAMVLLSYPWLLKLLQTPVPIDLIYVTVLYAVLFAFTDFSVYCLQALMLQEQLRLSISVASLVRLSAVCGALFTGWVLSAETVLWIWTASEFTAAVIMAVPIIALARTARRVSVAESDRPRWPGQSSGLRALAFSNFLSALAGVLWQPYALRAIAGILLPVQQVAAYGFFQILVEKIRSFLPVYFFASMTEPLMSAHLTSGEEQQQVLDRMAIVVQGSVWLVAPLVSVFAIAGAPTIELLTGGKFGESAAVLAILLCQLLFSVHVAMLWSFFSVLGESRIIWRAAATPSVVAVPLLIICGMNYGMLGMALVVPINTIGILSIMIVRLNKMGYTFPVYWRPLLRIFLFALLVPLPAWIFMQIEWTLISSRPVFLALLSIGGISYLVANVYWLPFTREQAVVISRIFPWFNRAVRTNRIS